MMVMPVVSVTMGMAVTASAAMGVAMVIVGHWHILVCVKNLAKQYVTRRRTARYLVRY